MSSLYSEQIKAVGVVIVRAMGTVPDLRPGLALAALADVAGCWLAEVARQHPEMGEDIVDGFYAAVAAVYEKELHDRELIELSARPLPTQKM